MSLLIGSYHRGFFLEWPLLLQNPVLPDKYAELCVDPNQYDIVLLMGFRCLRILYLFVYFHYYMLKHRLNTTLVFLYVSVPIYIYI